MYWLKICPHYNSRVVIYNRKMIIRLATGARLTFKSDCVILTRNIFKFGNFICYLFQYVGKWYQYEGIPTFFQPSGTKCVRATYGVNGKLFLFNVHCAYNNTLLRVHKFSNVGLVYYSVFWLPIQSSEFKSSWSLQFLLSKIWPLQSVNTKIGRFDVFKKGYLEDLTKGPP